MPLAYSCGTRLKMRFRGVRRFTPLASSEDIIEAFSRWFSDENLEDEVSEEKMEQAGIIDPCVFLRVRGVAIQFIWCLLILRSN